MRAESSAAPVGNNNTLLSSRLLVVRQYYHHTTKRSLARPQPYVDDHARTDDDTCVSSSYRLPILYWLLPIIPYPNPPLCPSISSFVFRIVAVVCLAKDRQTNRQTAIATWYGNDPIAGLGHSVPCGTTSWLQVPIVRTPVCAKHKTPSRSRQPARSYCSCYYSRQPALTALATWHLSVVKCEQSSTTSPPQKNCWRNYLLDFFSCCWGPPPVYPKISALLVLHLVFSHPPQIDLSTLCREFLDLRSPCRVSTVAICFPRCLPARADNIRGREKDPPRQSPCCSRYTARLGTSR